MDSYNFASLDANDICALDYETFYEKDFLSVKKLGNVNYARLTTPYMVALFCPARGVEYVGDVKTAPWDKVAGALAVSHNASFDSEILAACQKTHRLVPKEFAFAGFECSSDLSMYCGLGSRLDLAVASAYGVKIDKKTRDKARGKVWPHDFKPEEQEQMLTYCLDDSKYSYQLWKDFRDEWPSDERAFAGLIRFRCRAGVLLDTEKLLDFRLKLELIRAKAKDGIPWSGKELSPANARKHCAEVGIPAPTTFSEKKAECIRWENQYAKDYPFVHAVRSFRKSNMHLRRVETMGSKMMKNKRLNFDLRYHGAEGTGRLSGQGGFNIQNLPRGDFEGIDLRSLIIAPRGKKLIISDFAQIEPRVICYVTGDIEKLEALRQGANIYELEANWNGKRNTLKKLHQDKYAVQKVITLGLCYGMKSQKFRDKVAEDGVVLSAEEAELKVWQWEKEHPRITGYWNMLWSEFLKCFACNKPFQMELRSGRKLTYYDIQMTNGDYRARVSKGSHLRRFWKPHLFENYIQATARDVLRDAVLRLEAAGIPICFSAHDEVIAEVPKSFNKDRVTEIMLQPPSWAPDLPMGVETEEAQEYKK